MYLNAEKAVADTVQAQAEGKISKGIQHIICLTTSTEGTEMKVLLEIANILRAGGGSMEIVLIVEEPGETTSGEPGLFSLTLGFQEILD